MPAASVADFKALVDRYAGIYQSELAATEANLTVLLTAREKPAQLMSESLQSRLLDALMACPNGVMRMSDAIPGVTETSTNLGVIKTLEGEVYVQCLIRSLIDSGRENIEQMTRSLFTLAGASCEFTGAYPGWAPNVDSPVMALVRSSYQTLFGEMPNVMVIHAGLECGLFKSAYPDWDMVSFGPTIRGAHAPGRRYTSRRSSVSGNCWFTCWNISRPSKPAHDHIDAPPRAGHLLAMSQLRVAWGASCKQRGTFTSARSAPTSFANPDNFSDSGSLPHGTAPSTLSIDGDIRLHAGCGTRQPHARLDDCARPDGSLLRFAETGIHPGAVATQHRI